MSRNIPFKTTHKFPIISVNLRPYPVNHGFGRNSQRGLCYFSGFASYKRVRMGVRVRARVHVGVGVGVGVWVHKCVCVCICVGSLLFCKVPQNAPPFLQVEEAV